MAEGHWQKFEPDADRKLVAGNGTPALELVCGCFSASLSGSIDLLSTITDPIVEQFAARDQLDRELKSALRELLTQEIGASALTSALLKRVLVGLFRRPLSSRNLWVERVAVVGDPQIALAFAEMAAKPGIPHTVQSLSRMAGLSRSVFMARFTAVFGSPPVTVHRQLRMRHAAFLLATGDRSIDQICCEVGYASRSSFFRAFHKSYGSAPMDHCHSPKRSSSSAPDEMRSEAGRLVRMSPEAWLACENPSLPPDAAPTLGSDTYSPYEDVGEMKRVHETAKCRYRFLAVRRE